MEPFMNQSGIAKPDDFRRALERSSVEQVVLPASGLSVLLCRPPVFAALAMGRTGTQLQARITEARPDEVKPEDIEAFTQWLGDTLARLFVKPRFAMTPAEDQIGLADILIDDLKFVFRWLRGEVFSTGAGDLGVGAGQVPATQDPAPSTQTEDLGRFPGGQGAPALPGGSGETLPVSPERTPGAGGDACLPAGLHRG
jgi:hypothetical protein